MIKFILPAVIIFLVVLFWEKICEVIYKRFNIKLNYIIVGATILIIVIVYLLIKN